MEMLFDKVGAAVWTVVDCRRQVPVSAGDHAGNLHRGLFGVVLAIPNELPSITGALAFGVCGAGPGVPRTRTPSRETRT